MASIDGISALAGSGRRYQRTPGGWAAPGVT